MAIKSSAGTLVLRGEVRDAIEAANRMAALAPLDNNAIEQLAQLSQSIPPAAPLAEVHRTSAKPVTAAPAAPTVSQSK